MLYELWCQVARQHRDEHALWEDATGKHWTFGELHRIGETRPVYPGPFAYPSGHTAEFIFEVLTAWREQQVLCPLETGQSEPSIPVPPKACIHLKSTSASTGQPRWVAFTAHQLMADVENIVLAMDLRPEWPNIGAISLAHSYGFSNLVLPLLLRGIPLILAASPLPESLRTAAGHAAQIVLPGVPALWRAWHEANALPLNIRKAISAGAPLPLSLEQEVFRALGLKIHNFLGSSECGGIAYDATERPRADESCVGTAMSNVDVTIHENGCLTVKSRAVGETYWPEPGPVISNGCFQTADLGEIREGLIYLRGRASDLINVAGRKIAPESIERTLLESPGVKECLVLGLPSQDADRAEWILAIVSGESHLRSDSLRQFLLERLPAWQVPREWWFVDSIKTDNRGKISRAAWREKFLAARGARNAP